MIQDITDRKLAEQSLRESEERFRILLDLAPLPLGLVSTEGVITFRNQRFANVSGYTTEDAPTVSEWWQRAYPDPEYRQ
jgi:PAS domain S-box-containing protein